jgi:hypothetical protein
MYALPEAWQPAETDVVDYKYHLDIAGIQFRNGRAMKRELTEEEKKAIEEEKTKKKPADKKKGQEAEPTPEELEAMEKERLEKEAEEARIQAEWDKLDEDTKFHRISEDIYKSPCVVWERPLEEGEEEQVPPEGSPRTFRTFEQTITKAEEDLNLFEEQFTDSCGFYISLERI